MVVPVATAQLVAASFRATYVVGLAIGFLVALGGVVLSYYIDTPRAERSCCWRSRLFGSRSRRRVSAAVGRT